MDTLSSSVSTLNITTTRRRSLHRKSLELHRNNHFPRQPSHFILSSTTKPTTSKLSNFKITHNDFINPPFPNSSQPSQASPSASSPVLLKQSSSKPKPNHHQKASTGYAVALLDAARCHNAVEAVGKDAKRLSKWLRNEELRPVIANPFLGNKEKGEVLREIVKKGKFQKHLLKLVNLLVEKSKVGMLSEVLIEFGRIYDEVMMSGSDDDRSSTHHHDQVVLVPSGLKMEENQVLGIAKSVQRITGALKVTVIRQVVGDEIFPSFAT